MDTPVFFILLILTGIISFLRLTLSVLTAVILMLCFQFFLVLGMPGIYAFSGLLLITFLLNVYKRFFYINVMF